MIQNVNINSLCTSYEKTVIRKSLKKSIVTSLYDKKSGGMQRSFCGFYIPLQRNIFLFHKYIETQKSVSMLFIVSVVLLAMNILTFPILLRVLTQLELKHFLHRKYLHTKFVFFEIMKSMIEKTSKSSEIYEMIYDSTRDFEYRIMLEKTLIISLRACVVSMSVCVFLT